jgi:hypothetical protein
MRENLHFFFANHDKLISFTQQSDEDLIFQLSRLGGKMHSAFNGF